MLRCYSALLLLANIRCCGQPLLTLQDAIELAVRDNRQVRISVLGVIKAVEATAEVKTARLPQFSTYILAGSTMNTVNFTIPRGALGAYPTVGPIPGKDSNISTSPALTGLIYGS